MIDYAAEWEARARANADHEACSETDPAAWIASAYRPLAIIMPALAPSLVSLCEVLDYGCGPGRLLIPVANAIEPIGGWVNGLDVSPTMVATAQSRIESIGYGGLNNARATVTDAGKVSLVGPFDGAYSLNVFQHCDPDTIRETLYEIRIRLAGRLVFQYVTGSERAPWMYQYSEAEMEGLCAAAGLTVIEHTQDPWQHNWRWIVATA